MDIYEYSDADGSDIIECIDGECAPGIHVSINRRNPAAPVYIRRATEDGEWLDWQPTGLQTADIQRMTPEQEFRYVAEYCGWIE